jgi:hypothetical protein
MVAENWFIPETEDGRSKLFTYQDALTYCETHGAEWKLLSSDDIPIIRKTFVGHDKKSFMLADPANNHGYYSFMEIDW